MNSKRNRLRSRKYRLYVGTFPCLSCSIHHTSVAHHVQYAEGQKAMSLKVSDEWVVPLCTPCHTDLHAFGDEKTWWDLRGTEPLGWCRKTYGDYRRFNGLDNDEDGER